MNPLKNCTYSLVPSKKKDKDWNLQMIAIDLNVCDVKAQDTLEIDLITNAEGKCLSHNKSIQNLDKEQGCSTPLVIIKKEIESDDGSIKSHMNIDMSIIKEEVIDIDEIADYTWQDEMIRETSVNAEEDNGKCLLADEDQRVEGAQLSVPLQRKRRCRRPKDTVKPKHWCSICKCKHESAYALAMHRRKLHMNAARYRCSYCPNVFFHHSNRNKHELTHLGPLPRHHCKMCDRSFARKYGLEAHVRSVHTGERPYVCKDCGMTFTRDGCYRLHRYVHTGERPHSCPVCPRAFSSKSDLDRHTRVHTGEKPYSCEKCRRTFRLRGQLSRHLKSHTGEKPLACGLCPKMFRIGTNVALHRGSHIVNSAVLKIHKCKICQREFARKGNLKAHFERHTATKSIECSHCGLAFKNKADLAKHENIHTREKIFLCDTCGKSFLRKMRLRNHVKIHLFPNKPIKPTTCEACGRKYKFPSQLKIHQKNKRCKEDLKRLKKEK